MAVQMLLVALYGNNDVILRARGVINGQKLRTHYMDGLQNNLIYIKVQAENKKRPPALFGIELTQGSIRWQFFCLLQAC